MKLEDLLLSFEKQLDKESLRTKKPRKTGITMALIFDVANRGPQFLESSQELVDRIKLLDTLWHHDITIVERSIKQFREMQMDVAMGGTQFEIAKAQGKMNEYLDLLNRLGVNEVEVENHASGSTLTELKTEVKMLKEKGFKVVAEIGKKWAWKDDTRATRDLIHVDKVVEQANTLLEAGADHLYWEGMVVRSLIGTQLENHQGQKQFKEVIRQVDSDKLILEIWNLRSQPNLPIIAWLVRELGPNVNLANIFPEDIRFIEWIRHGIIFEMDHPYMRWSQDRSVAKHWWQIESPDYSVDMHRNYALQED